MKAIDALFERNQRWAARVAEDDPNFFRRLAKQQKPRLMWVGCSDSRVPANQIVDMNPGEVFVHRNVANLVHANDMNCMSAVELAVDVLKVRHIIVCGHYECSGVRAAMQDSGSDLAAYWVDDLRATIREHREWAADLPEKRFHRAMCEVNVITQVESLCNAHIIRRRWESGSNLDVHGCVYAVENGLLQDLGIRCSRRRDVATVVQHALMSIRHKYLGK